MLVLRTGIVSALIGAPLPSAAQSASQEFRLDIPRQEMTGALAAFARETGVQFAHLSKAGEPAIFANAVVGRYSVPKALDLLLDGSGYCYKFVNDRTVAIVPRAAGAPLATVASGTPLVAAALAPTSAVASVESRPKAAPRRVASLFAGLVAALTTSTASVAQDAAAGADAAGHDGLAVEEVIVTARRREESVLETPLSVTVFSGAELERAGIQDLEDVADLTAGMQFITTDRLDGNIRMRGVIGSGARSTTSVYVDGVFALQSAQSLALADLERVEVIKGPQSASFGRNAFAGSVNYVTGTPSLSAFKGTLQVEAATRDQNQVTANVDFPLIEDRLSLRLGGRLYNKGAMYAASDGGGLGEESSQAVFMTMYAEPTDSLSLKFRAYYQEDEDGPGTSVLLRGVDYDTCTGTTRQGLNEAGAVVTLRPREFICGQIPLPGEAGAPRVDSNTTLRPRSFPAQYADFLIQNLRPVGENVEGVPNIDHLGTRRNITRLSLTADYEFANQIAASGTISYNENAASHFRDFDRTPIESWWNSNPQAGEDKGIDVKLTSPADRRLRWLFGVSAYTQDFKGQGDGDLVHVCGNFPAITNPMLGRPCDFPFYGPGNPISGDYIDVWGVFAMLGFDITDKLTLDVEGRYQEDTRSTAQDSTFEITYKDFVPRYTLRYGLSDNMSVYGLYAEGLLPGSVNGNLIACNPNTYSTPFISIITGRPSTSSECEQFREQLGGDFSPITETQYLDSWELGFKASMLDGRLAANVALYYQEWVNRPSGLIAQVVRDDNRDGIPNPIHNNVTVSVPGSAEYKGVEAEVVFQATERWENRVTASYNRSEYVELVVPGLVRGIIHGTTNLAGNRVEQTPEWTGSFSSTYRWPIRGGWEMFVRGDAVYRGKIYAGDTNLSVLGDYTIVDARLGFERDDLRVELFAKNLFDEDHWVTASETTDFSRFGNGFDFSHMGVLLVPQDRRVVGIRASYSFY